MMSASESQSVEVCSTYGQEDQTLRRRITDNREKNMEELTQNASDDTARSQTQSPEHIGVIHPHGPQMEKERYRRTFRAQTYSSTKTVAQGFLNISLLSANAGQLKIVLQQGSKDCMFYELLLTMIGLSFLLQLSVSYLLASKYMMEMDGYEDEKEQEAAMRHNSWATFLVTLISAVNVIIATFIGH